MRFQVIGSNRATGARMTLEFEAESKAAAERKATQQGMSVNRVQDITDGYVGVASVPSARAGRRRGWGGFFKTFFILIIIAAALWYFRHSFPGLR